MIAQIPACPLETCAKIATAEERCGVAVRPEVELRQPPSDDPSFTVGVPYLSISNRTPTVMMEGISPRQATSRIELLQRCKSGSQMPYSVFFPTNSPALADKDRAA